MPLHLTADDLAFLQQAEELAHRGLIQEDIAAKMGLSFSAFRLRVHELGFRFQRRSELHARAPFGGRSFAEMLTAGDIRLVEPAGATR